MIFWNHGAELVDIHPNYLGMNYMLYWSCIGPWGRQHTVGLRQFISFYHVARLRSLSGAARALHIGQPTVTTHLLKLEDEFGITLFDRSKRPIQLTFEGVTLLELVTPMVNSVDALKNQMEYTELRGSFTVGAYPDLVTHHLPVGIQNSGVDIRTCVSACLPAPTTL